MPELSYPPANAIPWVVIPSANPERLGPLSLSDVRVFKLEDWKARLKSEMA